MMGSRSAQPPPARFGATAEISDRRRHPIATRVIGRTYGIMGHRCSTIAPEFRASLERGRTFGHKA